MSRAATLVVLVACCATLPCRAQTSPVTEAAVICSMNLSLAVFVPLRAALPAAIADSINTNASRIRVSSILGTDVNVTNATVTFVALTAADQAAGDAATSQQLATSFTGVLRRATPAQTAIYNAYLAHYAFAGFTVETRTAAPPTTTPAVTTAPAPSGNGTSDDDGSGSERLTGSALAYAIVFGVMGVLGVLSGAMFVSKAIAVRDQVAADVRRSSSGRQYTDV